MSPRGRAVPTRAQAQPAPPLRLARRRGQQWALLALLQLCLHRVPGAHTSSGAGTRAHHADTAVAATCIAGAEHGGGQVSVAAWSNLSGAAADYGARGYLSGVEMFWNAGDALFPVYRHAAVLFGGRGAAGDIRDDTWMIPISPADPSPSLSNATRIPTHGEPAPARWGHSAVWSGRGSDRAETWATPRSYAGTIEENDDLVSKQGHPLQDIRHTISGKLQASSTMAPCQGGNTMHAHTKLPCDSLHGRSGGCSCVRLEIHSRTNGALDADTVVTDNTSSLYPSVWSGRRLEVVSGPGAGYEGMISYNGPNTYNLAPAVDFQFGTVEDDTVHFVLREAEPMWTVSVPLDTMWVFGGRDQASALTNQVHALTTSMPTHLDGVLAASSVDYQYSPTGIEDYTRSTQGWFYEKSVYTDFGTPDRPTPGPSAPSVVPKGPPEVSVCGEYGSILGGYQLLGPYNTLSKTYVTSVVHTSVQITFDFIKIDFWDGQQIELSIDGNVVWSREFRSQPNATTQEPEVCGRDDPPGFRGETLVAVNVTVAHSRASVNISLQLANPHNGSSVDSWWGIRRVHEMMFVYGGSTAVTTPNLQDEASVFTDATILDTKLADLYAFNTTSETWHKIDPALAEQARDKHGYTATAPVARSHHTFVKGRGDSLVLYGGQSQSGLFISDVHILQAREHKWETAVTVGRSPGPRAAHAAVVSAGRMWVYGGYRMDISSRNVKLQDGVHYLQLSDLSWHEMSTPPAGSNRYGAALVSGPRGSFVVAGGATAIERPGLPGVFPSGTPTAPAMETSLLNDAYLAHLTCVQASANGVGQVQRRALLTCNSMGEIDWLRAETEKLQYSAAAEILQLETRLTAAYLAAAERRDQYRTDMEWLDYEVTRYTDLVQTLVREGKVYTDQMSTLAQARRNRVEMEVHYVFYTEELEGRKLALHMQLDETRQRYEKAIERLEIREAVLTRQKAEGALSAGMQHSCAINAQDSLQCWGLNDIHQSDPPLNVAFKVVAAGNHHSCGIRALGGGIECWGSNSFGKSTPPPSATNKAFTDISAGGGHVCAIQKGGTMVCFGDNREGQAHAPKADDGEFVMVSAGYVHTCALRAVDASLLARRHGRIECWGKPADLRLKAPSGIFKWISAGNKHSCAVDLQGRVHCWGSNSHGQVAAPRSTFSTVSAGHLHTCGVRANGDLECWGSDVFGQAQVPRKRRWQVVSAGYEHTCGVDALRHQVPRLF